MLNLMFGIVAGNSFIIMSNDVKSCFNSSFRTGIIPGNPSRFYVNTVLGL